MSLVETEAVILKSYSLSEADKIIVFLTERQGLVRGVAKGAKRLKSKFGGSLEPFTISQIHFYQKEERDLVSIRESELIKSFFDSAGNPFFLQKFAYIAEILAEFAPPHEPNVRLYRMVRICLETAAIANKQEALEAIVLYFELWLLRLGGYLPDWSVCDSCRAVIEINERVNLQANYQLLCGRCAKAKSSRTISPIERDVFNAAQKMPPERFIAYAEKYAPEVKDISVILKRIISNILGREAISEKVLIKSAD